MIISIRGTSGSGKSTIARKVMACYENKTPRFIEGRKQPIGYHCHDWGNAIPPLFVVGHYESPCGGCDTIHTFEEVFKHVRTAHELGMNVLFEGVLLYCEIPLTVALYKEAPMTVIALTTPIEECVRSVNARRQAKNPLEFEPVDPKNTITKFNGTITSMERLMREGVLVDWCSREQAFQLICAQFDIPQGVELLQ